MTKMAKITRVKNGTREYTVSVMADDFINEVAEITVANGCIVTDKGFQSLSEEEALSCLNELHRIISSERKIGSIEKVHGLDSRLRVLSECVSVSRIGMVA